MFRSGTVVLLLAGLVLASGCLGAAGLSTSPEVGPEPDLDAGNATQVAQPNASDPVTLSFPELPEDLSAGTVGAYVAAHEEVRMHNELLSNVEATITELGTSCEATAVEADGEGFRVTVECGHWYEFESGSSVGIADGAPYRTTYVVGPDGIEWTGTTESVF